ncbi:unnamed protein product [Clonostachys byssicola]|uniref:Cyanovirin-N domain-containing protein n=1 Tax=Clonostachys byssicola TaxID=160290 RepID=A0A9N9V1S1_9HYPO|nr:unnamed protein product [Clonostachys byssicola]
MASLLKSILLLVQLSGQALALPYYDDPPALTTTSVSTQTQTSFELPYETLAVRQGTNSTDKDTSFKQTCKDISIDMPDGDLNKNDGPDGNSYKNSPRLSANCQESNGNYRCASINLSNCVANLEGWLAWAKDGNFHTSCKDCGLDRNKRELVCRCKKYKGSTDFSFIYLGEWKAALSPKSY